MSRSNVCSICHREHMTLGLVDELFFCKPDPESKNPGAVTPCEATARHRAVTASQVKRKGVVTDAELRDHTHDLESELRRTMTDDFARDLEAE